ENLKHNDTLKPAHHLGRYFFLLGLVFGSDPTQEKGFQLSSGKLTKRNVLILDAIPGSFADLGNWDVTWDFETINTEDVDLKVLEIPFGGVNATVGIFIQKFKSHILSHFQDVFLLVLHLEELTPKTIDLFALLVHHVVVLEQMLTHLEVTSFDLFLRPFDLTRD